MKLLTLALVFSVLPSAAQAEKSVDEILRCVQGTRPLTNTVRKVQLTTVDRQGVDRVRELKIYGGVSRDGLRTVLFEVTHPKHAAGTAVLITERPGANHVFVSLDGLPEVKQISGAPGQYNLFRSDLTYEDVEHLYRLSREGETHELGEVQTMPDGRKHWLLETKPAEARHSSYTRVVSMIDVETCVLMRAEMYQGQDEPRKVMTADPDRVKREGPTWVAHEMRLRDLRDGTETRVVLQEIAFDVKHEGIPFTPEELQAYNEARARD